MTEQNADSELSQKYQQKTDREHILSTPDTYIGSVEQIEDTHWILNETGTKIVSKSIQTVPGLFKLFDEGIVNCRDHVMRMSQSIAAGTTNALPVTNIEISILDDGTIVMMNDGNGIDVAEHPEYKIWIPELIFGHLRTSTNYDKNEKKIIGGKNGFGFKLVLIWSTFGSVETVDHVRGLRYYQEFKNNLDEICPPVIRSCKTKPFTKITFKPDYARFGIHGLSVDVLSLLRKRVYDIAAVTDKSLKVKYNSMVVPIRNFQQYIDLYIGDRTESPRAYDEAGERWEYAVALSPTSEFLQVSFVNGIHTSKGGKHVEYILNQITRKLVDFIEKRKKVKVNPNSIKEQLFLFLRCDIENPAFDSQTKDYMNTPSAKFGSKCEISDKFIEKVAKMGVMDAACAITGVKENKMAQKSDGVKTKNIRGIPKLTDANWAGTEKSNQCIIIFCEGDSAKAGIISGLSSEDRNTIGIYPMKGKILNVRGEATKKISENKEIIEIKQILGLKMGKQYTAEDAAKTLRYGKVLFMTDQDLDGSHIKGLGLNLFQSEWPSLAEIPGFIGFMNTPILKANKGATTLMFYNDGEYNEWKSSIPDINNWKIKYYKGLGTSTGKEFREYFQQKKIVGFQHNGIPSSDAIDMVFNKKRADDRKKWLDGYNRESFLDTNQSLVTYESFIHRELIHFSKYDCDRSIPNLMDGLKTSLRKILFAAFKKNLNNEIKVAQFSGYVSENACYHHGEASLNGAIVGMAQNFVGSNNINLLLPLGQFGSRLQGGNDSASERYIFTQLNSLTRRLFPHVDDNILQYLNDDGTLVEPLFYAPIIPMILVNGSKGIGTGFSTDVMCYNPMDVIKYLLFKLEHPDVLAINTEPLTPYYEGFRGTISHTGDQRFLFKGIYEVIGPDKIRVTELPVGFWTQDFKELLEILVDPPANKEGVKLPSVIRDFDDMSKDTTVDFTITFTKGKLEELEHSKQDNECNGVHKLLKLCATNSTSNMHLFDASDKLKKYASVFEIMDDYFVTRLQLYQARKDFLVNAIEKELGVLSNKAKYLEEVLNGTIDLRRKSRAEVGDMMLMRGYDVVDGDSDYKYLTKMPMDSVTTENVTKTIRDFQSKEAELEIVKMTSNTEMWIQELSLLTSEYLHYKEGRERLQSCDDGKTCGKKRVQSKMSVPQVNKKVKSLEKVVHLV